jgi:hypothetical protein
MELYGQHACEPQLPPPLSSKHNQSLSTPSHVERRGATRVRRETRTQHSEQWLPLSALSARHSFRLHPRSSTAHSQGSGCLPARSLGGSSRSPARPRPARPRWCSYRPSPHWPTWLAQPPPPPPPSTPPRHPTTPALPCYSSPAHAQPQPQPTAVVIAAAWTVCVQGELNLNCERVPGITAPL